jgi:hypothetical protein
MPSLQKIFKGTVQTENKERYTVTRAQEKINLTRRIEKQMRIRTEPNIKPGNLLNEWGRRKEHRIFETTKKITE